MSKMRGLGAKREPEVRPVRRQLAAAFFLGPALVWLSAWFVALSVLLLSGGVASALLSPLPYSAVLLAGIAGLLLLVYALVAADLRGVRVFRSGGALRLKRLVLGAAAVVLGVAGVWAFVPLTNSPTLRLFSFPVSFLGVVLLTGGVVTVAVSVFSMWSVRVRRRERLMWSNAGWRWRAALLLSAVLVAGTTLFAVAGVLAGLDDGGERVGLRGFLVLALYTGVLAGVVAVVRLAVGLVNAEGAHAVIYGVRWAVGSRKLRRWALTLLLLAVPVSLFTLLGFLGAVIMAFLQALALLVLLRRPESSAAAFAVLTIFVLSIVSFNSLRGISTLVTTPFHLFSVGWLLTMHRERLRLRPVRLRLLVRWGVGLALGLVVVQLVLLAVNLPLGLALLDMPGGSWGHVWISDLYQQRSFIMSWTGDGLINENDPPLVNFTYLGFNIVHGLFAAGLLLLLGGRLPRRRQRVVKALVAAASVVVALMPLLMNAYPVVPFSDRVL